MKKCKGFKNDCCRVLIRFIKELHGKLESEKKLKIKIKYFRIRNPECVYYIYYNTKGFHIRKTQGVFAIDIKRKYL